jgi:hypothetical protein
LIQSRWIRTLAHGCALDAMRLSTAVTIGDTFPEMFISVYVKRFTWARHAFELVSGCKSAQWRHPSMHGSFDRSGKSNNRIDRGSGIGFLALPATLDIGSRAG